MIRGFYAGSLGMIAQQQYLNTISNNVANVNTTAFKAQQTAFASLLYENVAGGGGGDLITTGHGAKVLKNGTILSQGALEETARPMDCAIDGKGFFALLNPENGAISYTRDGSFAISVEGDQSFLTNGQGQYVLGPNNNRLDISNGFNLEDLGVFNFSNPYGLALVGNNHFQVSQTSGPAQLENTSRLVLGYLERSGTDMGKEAVKMIEASRAFSFNARIVQAADDMERVINQLR